MRTCSTLFLTILSVFMILNTFGCSSDPATKAYQTRVLFNSALDETLQLNRVGIISDEQLREAAPLIEGAAFSLDLLDEAVAKGDTASWSARLDAASTSLDRLLAWLAQRRAGK